MLIIIPYFVSNNWVLIGVYKGENHVVKIDIENKKKEFTAWPCYCFSTNKGNLWKHWRAFQVNTCRDKSCWNLENKSNLAKVIEIAAVKAIWILLENYELTSLIVIFILSQGSMFWKE